MTVQKFHTMTSLSNNFFWKCSFCNGIVFEKESHYTPCPFCKKARLKMYKKCPCGEIFPVERSNKSFCSKECANRYKSKGGKKGKHYPSCQRARIATCPVCHKQFRAVKDTKKKPCVYCSKECWSKRGAHPRKRNPDPLMRAWKSSVLKRDNYTCQNCGSKRNLEAHHIKERKNYPDLKYDVSNGLCLCHDCHLKTDNYGYKAKIKAKILLSIEIAK